MDGESIDPRYRSVISTSDPLYGLGNLTVSELLARAPHENARYLLSAAAMYAHEDESYDSDTSVPPPYPTALPHPTQCLPPHRPRSPPVLPKSFTPETVEGYTEETLMCFYEDFCGDCWPTNPSPVLQARLRERVRKSNTAACEMFKQNLCTRIKFEHQTSGKRGVARRAT